MGYTLGIDLGTTFTAAAVFRDGRAEIANLGERASAVPSVVFLKDDTTILVGIPAERRAVTEPDRVAREFKRRFGDTTPIFLGGTPLSADLLTAKVLRWVYDTVAAVEGSAPDSLALTYPANWGPYKRELLDQTVNISGLHGARTLTEPEAAAIYYSTNERIDPGQVVAVYDLGGGTFDAAVLERIDDGFRVLGKPEGIERLGGIDFDAAVFAHVTGALGPEMDQLDPEDPATMAAVARLRLDCVEAKEALSADTEASIPVMLPSLRTEVRLTRGELEDKIRATIAETVEAMRRALVSAKKTPDEVTTFLLVGGSSRIPLVADMLTSAFGRPIAVDAHPKHSVSLGAAIAAADSPVGAVPVVTPPSPSVEDAAVPAPRKKGVLVLGLVLVAVLIGVGAFVLPRLGAGNGEGTAATVTTTARQAPVTQPVTATTLPPQPSEPPSEMCGELITSDLTLGEAVANCEGDGLVIGVDGVTIDLGGQLVSGAGTVGTVGIRLNGVTDVTILNGTVSGFGHGVVVENGGGAVLDSVVSTAHRGSGLLATGPDTVVTIVDSEFSANGEAGATFNDGVSATSRTSVFSNNRGTGLGLSGATVSLNGDTIDSNSGAGIAVIGSENQSLSTDLLATGVTLRGNQTGVFFLQGGQGTVEQSLIDGSSESGVRLLDAGEVSILDNQLSKNAQGIRAQSGTLLARGNVIVGSGLGVALEGAEANMTDNEVTLSEGNGFVVTGGVVVMTDNESSRNGGFGFEFGSGATVTDGGGNTASGNSEDCSQVCLISIS